MAFRVYLIWSVLHVIVCRVWGLPVLYSSVALSVDEESEVTRFPAMSRSSADGWIAKGCDKYTPTGGCVM